MKYPERIYKMKKTLLIGFLLISYGLSVYAEDAKTGKLLNLGRLPTARVSASSNNADFFQIRDAFDGDVPLKNGNYRAWVAKPHGVEDVHEWVNVRFLSVVSVQRIEIVGKRSVIFSGQPAELTVKSAAVSVTAVNEAGKDEKVDIAPVEFKTDIVDVVMPRPLHNVKNVKISFVAATVHPVMIREIQILGETDDGDDKAYVTPKIDGEVPEKYWGNIGTLSFYDPPSNLPLKRFIVTEKKAVIVNNKNEIVQEIPLGEDTAEKKISGNSYSIVDKHKFGSISRDGRYLIVTTHIFKWEEDRDSYFYKEIGEYVSPGDPGEVFVDVYDLSGAKAVTKQISNPGGYDHYCVETSSSGIDVGKCLE